MTFKELYLKEKESRRIVPTPAQIFVKEIADFTHKSEQTIRMWLSGKQMPDELTQSVLANKFNTTPQELFPTL